MAESTKQQFNNIVLSTRGVSNGQLVISPSGFAWRPTSASSSSASDSPAGATINFPAEEIASLALTVNSPTYGMLHVTSTGGKYDRFDGLSRGAMEKLPKLCEELFKKAVEKSPMNTAGLNLGTLRIDDKRNTMYMQFDKRRSVEFPLSKITQCVAPGKNELEVQFQEEVAGDDEVLVEMKLLIAPGEDDEDLSEMWHTDVLKRVGSKGPKTGDSIVDLEIEKCYFLTPRGKYGIEMFKESFRMKGKTYDYNIKYDHITQIFLLPMNGDQHTCVVISLKKPIRQGKQLYPHLVLRLDSAQDVVQLNMSEEELKKQYNNKLEGELTGPFYQLVARLFGIITGTKVYKTGDFRSFREEYAVKCSLKTSDGLLYPLRKSFFFIHKPATYIRDSDIESIEFLRYSGSGAGSARSFDLKVSCKQPNAEGISEFIFSQIDKNEYNNLLAFLSNKSLRIRNIKSVQDPAGSNSKRMKDALGGDESDDGGGGEFGGEDESEDSDFVSDDAGHESPSDDEDDIDSDSEGEGGMSDEDDKKKKTKKKKKTEGKRKKRSGDGDSDDGDSVAPKKKKKKASVGSNSEPGTPRGKKRTSSGASVDSSGSKKKKTKKKAKKDPNKPKRGLSSFMFFSQDKRKDVLAKDSSLKMGDIAKEIGRLWKEATAEDKVKYEELAKTDKERYNIAMESYVAPPLSEDEDSDDESSGGEGGKGKKNKKKKVKAKKDPNAPKKNMSAYMFFCAGKRAENKTISMTELGAGWKEVSDKDKEKYVTLAAQDKERYAGEMKTYVPPVSLVVKDVKKKTKASVASPSKKKKKTKAAVVSPSSKKKKKKTKKIDEPAESESESDDDDDSGSGSSSDDSDDSGSGSGSSSDDNDSD